MAAAEKQDPFSAATAQLTFHNFLEKMRHPSAVDLVRSVKGFIVSFLASAPDPKKDSVAVQQFLAQTEASFRAHPLWAGASEEELDSAGEGLEKYLLTKVFARAFGPVPEDAEKDRLLSERMAALHHFLRPEHLDIPASFGNEPSWLLAQKELGKLGGYKAPRDKLVCILNCCRVINNLLLNMAMAAHKEAPGADDFLPVLIYVVIKANPPALHSNLMYIQRYRSASRLISESAYFFTNALSAAAFIETLNPSSLSMDPAEFEAKMQHALAQSPANPEHLPPRNATTPPEKAGELPPRHSRSHSEGESSPHLGTQLNSSGSSPSLANLPARTLAPPPSPGLTESPADSASAPITQPGTSLAELEARGTSSLVAAAEDGQLAREYRFLYSTVGDLRVGDVDALLSEYKELVLKYEALARGLQEHNAALAKQLVVEQHGKEERNQSAQQTSGATSRPEASREGGKDTQPGARADQSKSGNTVAVSIDLSDRGHGTTARPNDREASSSRENKQSEDPGRHISSSFPAVGGPESASSPEATRENMSDAGEGTFTEENRRKLEEDRPQEAPQVQIARAEDAHDAEQTLSSGDALDEAHGAHVEDQAGRNGRLLMEEAGSNKETLRDKNSSQMTNSGGQDETILRETHMQSDAVLNNGSQEMVRS